MSNKNSESLLKSKWKILGLLLSLVALGFFVERLWGQLDSLTNIALTQESTLKMLIGVTLYLPVIMLAIIGWHLLAWGVGSKAPFWIHFRIFSISQFAKYVPGNFLHHAGRVALARRHSLPSRVIGVSMLIEVGWIVLAAAIAGAAGFSISENPLIPDLFNNTSLASYVVAMGILVIGLPFLVVGAVRWLSQWDRFPWSDLLDIPLPSFGILSIVLILNLSAFLLTAFLLDYLAVSIFKTESANLISLTSIYATAWVLGFLTPGAPAGLGIREAILTETLAGYYGLTAAVGVALLLRVITSLGDLTYFALGMTARAITTDRES